MTSSVSASSVHPFVKALDRLDKLSEGVESLRTLQQACCIIQEIPIFTSQATLDDELYSSLVQVADALEEFNLPLEKLKGEMTHPSQKFELDVAADIVQALDVIRRELSSFKADIDCIKKSAREIRSAGRSLESFARLLTELDSEDEISESDVQSEFESETGVRNIGTEQSPVWIDKRTRITCGNFNVGNTSTSVANFTIDVFAANGSNNSNTTTFRFNPGNISSTTVHRGVPNSVNVPTQTRTTHLNLPNIGSLVEQLMQHVHIQGMVGGSSGVTVNMPHLDLGPVFQTGMQRVHAQPMTNTSAQIQNRAGGLGVEGTTRINGRTVTRVASRMPGARGDLRSTAR